MAVPQTLITTLSGTPYTLTLHWCDPTGLWIMDIADSSGNLIIGGIPLVTGAFLLAQYKYLNFPGDFFVQSASDPDATPTFDNLGTGSFLYYIPNST